MRPDIPGADATHDTPVYGLAIPDQNKHVGHCGNSEHVERGIWRDLSPQPLPELATCSHEMKGEF